MLRALERAGNKLCDAKARQRGLGNIPAHERHVHASGPVDGLLDGAWTIAETVLDSVADDPRQVTAALDMYVRGLLTGQQLHSKDAMTAALRVVV